MAIDEKSRRDFVKEAIAAAALSATTMPAQERHAAARPFNGIQMGTHTVLDEGIEHCLDFIQDSAAINCLMVYTHTYHTDVRKPPQ